MSITPTLHRTFHHRLLCLFFLPAELPAHAAALFSAHPLSGFPAQSSVPQANPAFPIWSCGTLHRSFPFVPEALHTLHSARWCAGAFCQNRSLSYRHQKPCSTKKQEIHSLRNDLLLHKAFFACDSCSLCAPCLLLTKQNGPLSRTTHSSKSTEFSCKSTSWDVLRSREN